MILQDKFNWEHVQHSASQNHLAILWMEMAKVDLTENFHPVPSGSNSQCFVLLSYQLHLMEGHVSF